MGLEATGGALSCRPSENRSTFFTPVGDEAPATGDMPDLPPGLLSDEGNRSVK